MENCKQSHGNNFYLHSQTFFFLLTELTINEKIIPPHYHFHRLSLTPPDFFATGNVFPATLIQSLQGNSSFREPKQSLFKYYFSASNYKQLKGSFFVFVLGTYYSSGNMHVCTL